MGEPSRLASKELSRPAITGDAELDEGNVFEALLETWKLGTKHTWMIVDYNRQSLDKIVEDQAET